MTNLTKKDIAKFLKYLNKYKNLVGFSDWKIKLRDDYKPHTSIAEVWVDHLEKELEVQLYVLFKELDESRQKNVLFHELVHARINYFTKLCDRATEFFEEDLVNDLVRGFEVHGNLQW